ncbi:hypothetical protein T06_10153 [Trichinella sp. T6]|nr:hypothetical protein T06_10153 [Trichinella sp. T6]
MEIVYFTCHAQSVFLCFNCLMRTRILQLMLVQFHMENKEQLRQKMGNAFVNGSTAISVYVNEYLLVISLADGILIELFTMCNVFPKMLVVADATFP